MKRKYSNTNSDNVKLFLGTEIEHTPAFGMKTLFVVGLQPVEEILKVIEDPYTSTSEPVKHIYFGANQSFNPATQDEWQEWDSLIMEFLNRGYWCTLDLDVIHVAALHESPMCENRRFIPQISVKIPYLRLLNYNATIKIDDTGFEASNPGVWCHPLSKFTNRSAFTDWDAYTKDEVIT